MNQQPTASHETAVGAPAPEQTHQVLVNDEEQYCLWPAEKETPLGWNSVFRGSREACLAHVETVWTDMRPKSVRG